MTEYMEKESAGGGQQPWRVKTLQLRVYSLNKRVKGDWELRIQNKIVRILYILY